MNFIKTIALFALISVSALGNAETIESPTTWVLDSANSKVNFISIKKGNIGESHDFTDLSGGITDNTASITIKPDSVESRVPIRNERMREFLFETGLYPSIEISADVAAQLGELKPGDSRLATVPASVSMHGTSKQLDLELRINKLSSDILIVSSTQPVIVRAADYNMVEGISKLSALVNNLAIAETVPVSFSLQFRSAKEPNAQLAFFNSLSSLCGQRFEGVMTFPTEGQDDFAGKVLAAKIESCSETEIRVPFHVGEDRSRTWIVSETEHGLQLKHDHRHEDGTPDAVNMYGGLASNNGSELSQSFAADAHTAKIIPAASTNVWSITLDSDGTSMTYHLTRHDAPRFTAKLFLLDSIVKN